MSTRRRLKLLELALNCLARSGAAEAKAVLDNDQMEIPESTFAPGSRSEEHSHPVSEAAYVLAAERSARTGREPCSPTGLQAGRLHLPCNAIGTHDWQVAETVRLAE